MIMLILVLILMMILISCVIIDFVFICFMLVKCFRDCGWWACDNCSLWSDPKAARPSSCDAKLPVATSVPHLSTAGRVQPHRSAFQDLSCILPHSTSSILAEHWVRRECYSWVLNCCSWLRDYCLWLRDYCSWLLFYCSWLLDCCSWLLDCCSWLLDYYSWLID